MFVLLQSEMSKNRLFNFKLRENLKNLGENKKLMCFIYPSYQTLLKQNAKDIDLVLLLSKLLYFLNFCAENAAEFQIKSNEYFCILEAQSDNLFNYENKC